VSAQTDIEGYRDGTFSISSPGSSTGSIIGGLEFPYELFGCKVGFRFGRAVVWRHDAANVIAPDYDPRGSLLAAMAARQRPGFRS
jgi:hypothetical protein